MTPFHHLSAVEPEQWRVRYRRAANGGVGRVIDREDERLAAPDELVALALPGLARLGAIALLVGAGANPPPAFTAALHPEAAGDLPLLDRALAAHARDHGYCVAVRLEQAVGSAHAIAAIVSQLELGPCRCAPSSWMRATPCGHRAGPGSRPPRVPGALAEALGSMLVLHAAAGQPG